MFDNVTETKIITLKVLKIRVISDNITQCKILAFRALKTVATAKDIAS